MKITRQKYTLGFFLVVALLAVVRLLFPAVAGEDAATMEEYDDIELTEDEILAEDDTMEMEEEDIANEDDAPEPVTEGGRKWKKNRIYGVHSYSKTFPDLNDVQLSAARRLGVSPVKNRKEAEHRMNELVFMASSPYYHVDKLTRSEPYLVPEAALLLHDIGRAFFDSLQAKGIPLHKPIVTSVLRTRENIRKLRRHNVNATENSCHLYGTTFDITYLRYQTVSPPGEPQRRMVRNDTLKWVLSEVMRDMREQGRCYVKYEVKQACFHTTVRK